MKKSCLKAICTVFTAGIMVSCGNSATEIKSYNEGINIIPKPLSLEVSNGSFKLKDGMSVHAAGQEEKTVAEYFISKINRATGFDIQVKENGCIRLELDPSASMDDEGYTLNVTPESVLVKAKTAQGLFYGMQSFMQLLPSEIESPAVVKNVPWVAQAVNITDEPKFEYRGLMIDPCRHFMTVDEIKKQLDVMALFKMNRMHWHLTEDQGWRIEIKKYPKLAEVASKRIEADGTEYGGYYTQEEVKEIVKYASDRFITVVPEIELPGHELAAISAYPELSCKGQSITPRTVWGVEHVVMCAGKELPFQFLEDVIAEVAALFPGEYLHIGGDECPKTSWKTCPLCQKRIREEKLFADKNHTAEERLQSYFVQRMEKVAAKYGKKIIGWDEILEGGLSPTATVMSWRGEEGGIAAALTNHDVIMTPGSNGLYLDHYQGDCKIGPVAIGGFSPLEKTYSYNPVPDTLVAMGKENFIKGLQGNVWSEYLYTNDIREYRTFPRALAIAETGWTATELKDYNDFIRRIDNACVRLDGHGINYYIPMPEQPNGSCDFVAFTDNVSLTFTTNRPVKMVYTLDGTEPTINSTVYNAPLDFTENATVKIASVLPSNKMSRVRTVTIEKQTLSPAATVEKKTPGLNMEVIDGTYLNMAELEKSGMKVADKKVIKDTRELITYRKFSEETMRGFKQYSAIATGYVDIPADGVYFFSSDLEEVWIDGKKLIDNGGLVKHFCPTNKSVALSAGLHEFKVVFLGNSYGGYPTHWNDGSINIRKSDEESFKKITSDRLFH